MTSTTRSLLFLIFVTTLPVTQADLSAQTVPSPYRFIESRQEAGIFVGRRSPGTGRFGYGPSEGLLLGARYGVRISGPFALEAVAGFMPTTRDLVDPTRVEGNRVVGDVESQVVTLDARLRFSLMGDRTWNGLSPFFFLGGGGAFDTEDGGPEEEQLLLTDDRFEFQATFTGVLGTGIRWLVGDRFILRGDLALTMWQLKAPRGFRNPERELTGVDENEWVSGPSFTIGTSFRF